MSKIKKFVGIDISKDTFDVCYPNGKHAIFANDSEGFKLFTKQLDDDFHCVMEQTGRYHHPLAYYLKSIGIAVSVENSLRIKRFSQLSLKATKTDKADAKVIRDYAVQFEPKEWLAPKSYIAKCRELRALVVLLKKQKTALMNQQHSLKSSVDPSKEVTKFLKKELVELLKKNQIFRKDN